MAERIAEYTDRIVDRRGRPYAAHVEGALREDGRWEGRVVFEPVEAGEAVVTSAETTQSDVADLQYWASGLTTAYLEGALERAQDERRLASRGEWRERAATMQRAVFSVRCEEDRIPAELLGTYQLTPGLTRELPDGSRIRYVGTRYGGADGAQRTHSFELEYPERPDGAESWLRQRGVEARFDGS